MLLLKSPFFCSPFFCPLSVRRVFPTAAIALRSLRTSSPLYPGIRRIQANRLVHSSGPLRLGCKMVVPNELHHQEFFSSVACSACSSPLYQRESCRMVRGFSDLRHPSSDLNGTVVRKKKRCQRPNLTSLGKSGKSRCMPRPSRNFPGGLVYHVLNRGVGRRMLFDKGGDFLAFEKVIEETLRTCRMRICAFCILSNHWHAVVWPESDGDLSAFMQQITNMHVKRWKEHRHEVGYGHLYQGRYKCFPVETAGYFYQVVRYVERNARAPNLVARAEDWLWSSLRRAERDDPAFPILSDWPLPRPSDWLQIVNQPQSEAELDALRRAVRRGCPFGTAVWTAETAKQLKIDSTLHPLGRPRKEK